MTAVLSDPAFDTAWQDLLSSKSLLRVALAGDSIAKKFNASSIAASWAGRMTAELKALQGDGGTGFRGLADAGYPGGTFLSGFWDQMPADDRVTLAGAGSVSAADAWFLSTSPFMYQGPGFTMGATTTVGATATFRVAGDTVAVHYLGINGTGGTITCTVDGVAAGGTINVGGRAANAPARTIIKTGAGAGMHTVVVKLASGGLNLYGASAENASGVVVNNFSKGGLAAAQAVLGGNTGIDWNGGASYPCDLFIYALGVNDLAATDATASEVADHVGRTVARLRACGITAPVLLVANHPGTRDANGRQAAVQARLREVAEAYNGAYVALGSQYGNSWAEANAAGYWGSSTAGARGTDTVHPSDVGHAIIWDTLRPLLVPPAPAAPCAP